MELTAEVVTKMETATLEGTVTYTLHLKLSIDREGLEAQGGGILAAVKVDKDRYDATIVPSVIHFVEK